MQAAHAHFGLGGIVGPVLVGYYKYKVAFSLLGVTSCCTLILTILQLLYERAGHISAGSYGNIDEDRNEEENCRADKEKQDAVNGDVEMTQLVSGRTSNEMDDKELAVTSSGDSEAGEAPVLNPPFALKLLLASFFFVYVGIEIGYGGMLS